MKTLLSLSPRRLAAVGAALLIALAAGVFLLIGTDGVLTPAPTPTPTPNIVAEAGNVGTLPVVGDDVSDPIVAQLEEILTDVYERAFLPPIPVPPSPDASPQPTPRPRPPLGDLFTGDARAAMEGTPESYSAAPDELVRRGQVTFEGVVTVEGASGTTALLDVTFTARGRVTDPEDAESDGDPMRLEHTGTIFLVFVENVWRVAGFDVELTVERQVPQEAEEAEAFHRRTAARWMP